MTAEQGWYKSSYSQDAGCVEIKVVGGGVLVRDSKVPERPALEISGGEWRAFVGGVRAGEFGSTSPQG